MSDFTKLKPEHRQALLKQAALAMRDDARCGEDEDWVYDMMRTGFRGLDAYSDIELLDAAERLEIIPHMVEHGLLPKEFLSRVTS